MPMPKMMDVNAPKGMSDRLNILLVANVVAYLCEVKVVFCDMYVQCNHDFPAFYRDIVNLCKITVCYLDVSWELRQCTE